MKNNKEFELSIFTENNVCDFLEVYESVEECHRRIKAVNKESPISRQERWNIAEYVDDIYIRDWKIEENYNLSLTEAKESKEYKYIVKSKEEMHKLIQSLQSDKSMKGIKEDVYAVLELGNIDIELNVLNNDGLIDIGYVTCIRFLNENNELEWETHGYTDDIKIFDIGDLESLEEIMFNTLMKYADKHNLKYSEPN